MDSYATNANYQIYWNIYIKYARLRNTLCKYFKTILDKSIVQHTYRCTYIIKNICCIYKSKKKRFFISNFFSFIHKDIKKFENRRFLMAWSKCLKPIMRSLRCLESLRSSRTIRTKYCQLFQTILFQTKIATNVSFIQ